MDMNSTPGIIKKEFSYTAFGIRSLNMAQHSCSREEALSLLSYGEYFKAVADHKFMRKASVFRGLDVSTAGEHI